MIRALPLLFLAACTTPEDRLAGPPLPLGPAMTVTFAAPSEVDRRCRAAGAAAAQGRVVLACQKACIALLPEPGPTVSLAKLGALVLHEAKHCGGAKTWEGHE